jgi:DNA-3-methyladenine glycosylase I
MPDRIRCTWAQNDPLMRQYHDTEWGVPQHDSRALWETLMLEGFQAGLSWITILRKRETFREAYQAAGEDLSQWAWNLAGGKPILNTTGVTPAQTPLSAEISAALKKRGYKFVGPVIVYAWMQATGIVNDHAADCFRRKAKK